MKKYILAVFALCLVGSVIAQSDNSDRFSLVRVHYAGVTTLRALDSIGVELDHAVIKHDAYVETVANTLLIEELQRANIPVEIVLRDAEAALAERLRQQEREPILLAEGHPENFSTGSMGGFFTLEELYAEFERMHQFAPEVVAKPIVIGTSVRNLPLYAYKICASSATVEQQPEVLYTALHHAREPGSASTLVYFLWHLLEQYSRGDKEAEYLLTKRQLWVLPCLNPDGYEHNRETYPNGGGLWRKNRRPLPGNAIGVDLNRNYGPQEAWNAANGGSSDNPRSDTYRGAEPFSEPETAAIRDFFLGKNFKTALNYHTFSNLLVYPLSYINQSAPDSTYFHSFAAEITRRNLYSAGTDLQTVGYSTRGVSDDWMYLTANTRAFTPEVGTVQDFFWPRRERIFDHGKENLSTNIQSAWSARANIRPVEFITRRSLSDTTEVVLALLVQNIGVHRADSGTRALLRPLLPSVTCSPSEQEIAPLASTVSQTLVWNIRPRFPVLNGDKVPMELTIIQEGVPRIDTLFVQVLQPETTTLFNGTQSSWQMDKWGIVNDPRVAAPVLFDNAQGAVPNAQNFLTYDKPISLSNARAATLRIRTRWSIESNGDFGIVQVSADSGATWEYLRSSLMKPGTNPAAGHPQERGSFGFDGNFPIYTFQEFTLDNYVGKDVLLRFGSRTDGSGTFEGWYISHITMDVYRDIPVSVAMEQEQHRVAVSPIPAHTFLRVAVPNDITAGSIINYALYTIHGEKVLEQSKILTTREFYIGTEQLPTGMYFLQIQNGTRRYMQQFPVQK